MTPRAAGWRRLVAPLVQYVTLRSAFADAERMPQDQHDLLTRGLDQASQKRDAAAVLFSRGTHAESIRLGVESATLLGDCAAAVGGSAIVTTRRVQRGLEDLKWASAKLSPPPVLDAQVTRAHKRALRTLLRVQLALERPLRDALLGRRGLQRLRVQRMVTAVLVAASPLIAVAFVKISFLGPTARASSILDDQYAADRVLDGDQDTEWVAGGGEEWLELRFRPRLVHRVRILNGDTLPGRAIKEIHVDFYDRDDSFAGVGKVFDRQYPAQWQTVDVGAIRCDRVRIVVKSHYGVGAAIAEVRIE